MKESKTKAVKLNQQQQCEEALEFVLKKREKKSMDEITSISQNNYDRKPN